MKLKLAAIAVAVAAVALASIQAQPEQKKQPPPCVVAAECTMAYWYVRHSPPDTTVATRCSPIYCDTLLVGPSLHACVQTRYGLPGEGGFRPLSVCRAALSQ